MAKSSPAPVKTKAPAKITVTPKTIKFTEALLAILAGKKVTKLEWKDRGIYGFLNGGILSLHKLDGVNYQWVVSEGDMMGEDYIVI